MFIEVTENNQKQMVNLLKVSEIWPDENGDVRIMIDGRDTALMPDQSYGVIAEKLREVGALYC